MCEISDIRVQCEIKNIHSFQSLFGTAHQVGEEGEMGMATEQAREWRAAERLASKGDGFGHRAGDKMGSTGKIVRVWGRRLGLYIGARGVNMQSC